MGAIGASVRIPMLWTLGCCAAMPAVGQFSEVWGPDEVVAGEPCTIFAQWTGRLAVAGFYVDFPPGWTLNDAFVLRHGYLQIPLEVEEQQAGRYWVSAIRPLRGSFELVLGAGTNSTGGLAAWSMAPAMATEEGRPAPQDAYRIMQEVRQETPLFRWTNRALRLDRPGTPLVLDKERLPAIRRDAAFTVEAWIKTVARNRIVLSTWNGTNESLYPLELIIDTYGRVRSYHKQGPHHVSIASHRPVADGQWHHVALVHNPEDWSTRLYLDGEPADSIYDAATQGTNEALHLAVGHRLEAGADRNAKIPRFEGEIDEIRVWSTARSRTDIRTMMRQSESTREGLAVLGFDQQGTSPLVFRPATGSAVVGTNLAFHAPAQNFRGEVTALGVSLSWDAPQGLQPAYIIERSFDGTDFDEVDVVYAKGENEFTFIDESVASQVVFYRLRQRFGSGLEQLSGTIKLGIALRAGHALTAQILDNYPNPFNPETTISFEITAEQTVRLSVWDVSGQLVQNLVVGSHKPGIWQVGFNGEDLPSGTYFVRLVGKDGRAQTRKILLMK